jgi:hypothetical protein
VDRRRFLKFLSFSVEVEVETTRTVASCLDSRASGLTSGRMRHMAWEWVAPVAGSAATAIVGVAGIVATYWAGGRQQETALAVARQQANLQVAVAREERQQRRLEEAYLELLSAVAMIHYWVFTVYPIITHKPEDYTMPPVPEMPDYGQKEAMWTAYWSPRVEQLVKEWEAAVRELQNAGIALNIAHSTGKKGQESGIDQPALLKELPDRKNKVFEADKRIREQIRLELLGKNDGHAGQVTADSP